MPLRANSLFKSLGVITAEDYAMQTYDHPVESVNYPKHPLAYGDVDSASLPNIIFIVVDSWNVRSYSADGMPNTWKFGQSNE